MKFSIITISLNAGKYIKETIESVLNQSYKDFEIIVKDGMSTDNTIEMIPEDDRIRVVRKSDTGVYMAMNQAIEEVKGEFILFLNCGDKLFHQDILRRVADKISENENVVYYGNSWCNRELTIYPRRITRDFMLTSTICHQSVFFSKDIFAKFGGYDERYRICSDWKHMYEIKCKGVKFINLDFNICDYLGGGLSEGATGQECMDKEENEIIGELPKILQCRYKLLKTGLGHFYLKRTDNLQRKSYIDKEDLIKNENYMF